MDDLMYTAEKNVNKACCIAEGLRAFLDGVQEELSHDSRYYAVMSCLDDIVARLDEASDALDKLPR